jgi:hypothetical protein
VNVNVSATVGVPEITLLESVKPPGNDPLSTLHVIGVVPEAASVWLYAVPTVPPANVVVVIVGAVPAGGVTTPPPPVAGIERVWV